MQLANCALGRKRKNVLVYVAGDAVGLQVKSVVNEK